MTSQSDPLLQISALLPDLPGWATSARPETLEMLAFQAGAALTGLEALMCDSAKGIPVPLLASRLALRAAVATSRLEGRMAQVADLRDAYYLTPPGAARGPDGDLLAFWRAAARVRLADRSLGEDIDKLMTPERAGDVIEGLEAGAAVAKSRGPLAGCVSALRTVLAADSRAERIACLASDIVLARAVRWPVPLPVSASGLSKPLLRALVDGGSEAELGVQAKLLGSFQGTIGLAREVTRRATALRAVAPKLRAKGSEAAVALFLTEDIVAPSAMLSPMIQGSATRMTDRAARRFCDRLVDLGVAHERTGRTSFRLYGVIP